MKPVPARKWDRWCMHGRRGSLFLPRHPNLELRFEGFRSIQPHIFGARQIGLGGNWVWAQDLI